MKAYTDIEQSKKLAEILPLESADGVIVSFGDRDGVKTVVMPSETLNAIKTPFSDIRGSIPCWSLTALLEFLRNRHDCNYVTLASNKASLWCLRTSYYNHVWEDAEEVSENAVDACVKMIFRLEV